MAGAEGVVDVDLGGLGEQPCKVLVASFFAAMKAKILEEQDLPGLESLCLVANAVSDASVSDDASVPSDACSSWSEEKAARHGPVVACVGVSFDESTRRTFTSLSPPGDAAYLSDLVVSERERGEGLGRAMLEAAETFAAEMRAPAMYLHVAMKKPGVVRLYKEEGYGVAGVDPGVFGWRGRLLMRKTMRQNVKGEREAASAAAKVSAVR